MVLKRLTPKQSKFVDYYITTGNATESARLAGYSEKTVMEIGYENLRKPQIKSTIEKRSKIKDDARIAGMEEINEFWTNTMRDMAVDIKDRLKASELRAKVQGAFLDRVEVSAKPTSKLAELVELYKKGDEPEV